MLSRIVEGVEWEQPLERWCASRKQREIVCSLRAGLVAPCRLKDGPARLPGFLVPPMTLQAETPLVEAGKNHGHRHKSQKADFSEAAKLMSEQSGSKFSCHHLLVQVPGGHWARTAASL